MTMKRFRVGEEGENMESINSLANVLMLLSRGAADHGPVDHSAQASPGRVFECKTCSRQFPSFQALGGHRASHKKPRLWAGDEQAHGPVGKPRVHECSICGVEFSIGQALGGHMRRHRPNIAGHDGVVVEKKSGDEGKKGLLLDLNLPPIEEDMKLGRFGVEFVEKIRSTPMVDCFH